MLTFTLDTNCLIALDEQRPDAPAVEALVDRHRCGGAVVRVVATAAAETQRDGTVLDNFSSFQARLARIGLADLEILRPVCVFDLSYFDWCVFAHDEAEGEARELHEVLFPTAPFDHADAIPQSLDDPSRARAERKWRNRQLDLLVLQTHILAGADVFVTSDKNFMKPSKRDRLKALGASLILTPVDAVPYGR